MNLFYHFKVSIIYDVYIYKGIITDLNKTELNRSETDLYLGTSHKLYVKQKLKIIIHKIINHKTVNLNKI